MLKGKVCALFISDSLTMVKRDSESSQSREMGQEDKKNLKKGRLETGDTHERPL